MPRPASWLNDFDENGVPSAGITRTPKAFGELTEEAPFKDLQSSLLKQQEELLLRIGRQDEVLAQILQFTKSAFEEVNKVEDMVEDMLEEHGPPQDDLLATDVARAAPSRGQSSKSIFDDSHLDEERRLAAEQASDIKEEPRRQMTVDLSGLSNSWVERRKQLRKYVSHPAFEIFFASVILLNALAIGMEVELSCAYLHQAHKGQESGDVSPASQVLKDVSKFFTVVFSIELILRLGAFGREFFTSSLLWSSFDVVVVCSAWMEMIVELNSDASISGVSSMRILKIVRLTRLLRITRVIRVMKFVRPLRLLLQSMLCTLKELVWAVVLLLLIMYIFGILFAQAISDFVTDRGDGLDEEMRERATRYWGGLVVSMLSLFMSISGGVSWEQPIEPLVDYSYFWTLVYLFYISFSYFAVLNTITAVFCQNAIDSAQSDHDTMMHQIEQNKQAHVEKIHSLFSELDGGKKGYINFKNFQENCDKPAVKTFFETLQLDVSDAWDFFKLLDQDQGAAIEIEEFLMGCMRLRGTARALDMAKLMQQQAEISKKQVDFMVYVEKEFSALREDVSKKRKVAEGYGRASFLFNGTLKDFNADSMVKS